MIGEPHPHDSAHLHVTGKALYCDDIPLPADTLELLLQANCKLRPGKTASAERAA